MFYSFKSTRDINDMQLTFPISAPLQIELFQDKPRLLTDTPVADEDEESAGEMTDGELYLNSVYPVLQNTKVVTSTTGNRNLKTWSP